MISLELSTTLAFILYFTVLLYECDASPSGSPPPTDGKQADLSIMGLIKEANDLELSRYFSGNQVSNVLIGNLLTRRPNGLALSVQMKKVPDDFEGLPAIAKIQVPADEVLTAYGRHVGVPDTFNEIETLPAEIFNCLKVDNPQEAPLEMVIKRTPVVYKKSAGNETPIKQFFYQTYAKDPTGVGSEYKRIIAKDNLDIVAPVENI